MIFKDNNDGRNSLKIIFVYNSKDLQNNFLTKLQRVLKTNDMWISNDKKHSSRLHHQVIIYTTVT